MPNVRHKPPTTAICFLVFFGSIEILCFSASLVKFTEGAWLPVLLALFLMAIMFVWQYATIKKYEFDLHNRVNLDWLLDLGPSLGVSQVPGIGMVFTDLTSGILANFSHFVTNFPRFHKILVLVCVLSVPVPYVPPAEKFLIGSVGPPNHQSYWCIVRYGYHDVHHDMDSFETELTAKLDDFICCDWTQALEAVSNPSSIENKDCRFSVIEIITFSHDPLYEIDENPQPASVSSGLSTVESMTDIMEMAPFKPQVKFTLHNEQTGCEAKDIQMYQELQAGTAFINGHSHFIAKEGSPFLKRAAINLGYNFLKSNWRDLDVPPVSLLEVGMVYAV